MRFALIADTFPPLRNSGAVQLRDLAREIARNGHELVVMLPAPELSENWKVEEFEGATVLRLRAPQTKDVRHVRRTLAEFAMPFAMRRGLRKSPFASCKWDGVIWYSPSIFHGPLVKYIKQASDCKSYLIIRDIFPEWAADMELMGRGPAFRFFRSIARYQYSVADVIGVQTPGNLPYFRAWASQPGRCLDVLPNWLGEAGKKECAIQIDQTSLVGRKIFVYAGNMGVAQNMDKILQLAERLKHRDDMGFLFVGRGSEAGRLKSQAKRNGLKNVLFYDEIDPDEIPALYNQCHVGIVSLDPRHKSHNIPGKFLTYMQCGLPALANVNAGNDLVSLIREHEVGIACENSDPEQLAEAACQIISESDAIEKRRRCLNLFQNKFSVTNTANSIINHFI